MDAYLKRRYVSPLEAYPHLANSSPLRVARELGCSKLEAAKLILQAQAVSMPHVHHKLTSLEIKPPGHPGGQSASLILLEAEQI